MINKKQNMQNRDAFLAEKIKTDELNMRYEGIYKYTVTTPIYRNEYEGEVEAEDAETALEFVKEMMEEKRGEVVAGESSYTIYRWIPETVYTEGTWEDVDFHKIRSFKKLQSLVGMKITKVVPKIIDDSLKEIRFYLDDDTFIDIAVDDYGLHDLDLFIPPF